MPRVPRSRIRRALAEADVRQPGQSAADHRQQKGRALEAVVRQVLELVPGVEFYMANVLDVAGTEEVDILFWNKRSPDGFYHIDTPFLVECKNWTVPVPAREIVNFLHLLQMRSCRDGIFVAASGITGTPGTLQQAYAEISNALAFGRRILVITRQELESLTDTDQIVELLKLKIMQLTIYRTLQ